MHEHKHSLELSKEPSETIAVLVHHFISECTEVILISK